MPLQHHHRLRTALALAVTAGSLAALAACGSDSGSDAGSGKQGADQARKVSRPVDPKQLPGVGPKFRGELPEAAQQVVLVTGKGVDDINSRIALYERRGERWHKLDDWAGHNGKKGWATQHRMGDNRTPVGVFTLTDAGGTLPNPGSKLSYTSSPSFAAPAYWPKRSQHIFDLTIAIDYNRVKGTPPTDQQKPLGTPKGGNIWLHMDNGRGTAACVSQSKEKMVKLLTTLDPAKHPVIVMGDRKNLAA
jgi:L,D-peptidoglycan transpeptidase YkuD (ErfK/YbiS/YcfS/YnhG family)